MVNVVEEEVLVTTRWVCGSLGTYKRKLISTLLLFSVNIVWFFHILHILELIGDADLIQFPISTALIYVYSPFGESHSHEAHAIWLVFYLTLLLQPLRFCELAVTVVSRYTSTALSYFRCFEHLHGHLLKFLTLCSLMTFISILCYSVYGQILRWCNCSEMFYLWSLNIVAPYFHYNHSVFQFPDDDI